MTSNVTDNNNTDVYHTHSIPLSLHICAASLITIFNALIIFIYISMKKKKNKIPNYLMFAQALVDMYQAAVAWYETVVDILDRMNPTVYAMSAATYTALFEYSLTLCLLTLMLASVERYLSITKPFFHRKFVTPSRIVYGSLSVWLVSLVAPFCLMWVAKFDRLNLNSSAVTLYSYVFDGFLFTLIVIIITELALSLKVGKDSINVGIITQKQYLSNKTGEAVDNIMKKKLRLVTIFSIMIAVFLMSFLPFAIGRLLFDAGLLNSLSVSHQYKFLATCHIVYKSSSLFNPLLTLTLKDDYRNVLMRRFKMNVGH